MIEKNNVLILLILLFYSCSQQLNKENREPLDTTPLSPIESIAKIKLPDGFEIECIASEPMIKDPVTMAWDANGDLYVAQMNTFMLDLKATNQHRPFSQVIKLVDENEDGIMDKSTVFADSLLLPRVILPFADEIIIQLTDTQHLYAYKDTNNDGKSDIRRKVFENNTLDHRNMEHQNGGLVWNLDNWIYPSRDNLRYKYKNGKLIADTMYDHMIGQWGMTTDDYGRLYYSEAGPGLPAVQFQQMPQYGSLNFTDQYDDDFSVPYPIMSTLDANGGDFVLDSNTKKITRFTSGCGQSIFRGDRLSPDMLGDYFIPEPVARIIKRGKISNENGKRIIHNAYKEKDWLASSDFNFRPVNTYTGPDGCFYIVDMYRGIIQEGEFADTESYLSKLIKNLGLEQNKGYGRIYRVKYKGREINNNKPNLLKKSNTELVQLLDHKNGWYRDNAQQLLIIRNALDIIPLLNNIVTSNNNSPLFKIHSIWTLEGLNALSDTIILAGLKDTSSIVRKSTIWASESKIKEGDHKIMKASNDLTFDKDPDVKIQLYLSLRTYGNKEVNAMVEKIVKNNKAIDVIQYSHKIYLENKHRILSEEKSVSNLSQSEKAFLKKGQSIYQSFCSTCHGSDGRGIRMGNAPMPAPPLAGSPRITGDKIMIIQILLNGLSGELDGKKYAAPMLPQKHNSDEYIASVLSYLRTNKSMGNTASLVSTQEVEDIRLTSPVPEKIPILREFEIYKLGRNEAQNWEGGKPGSNGYKWGGRFLNDHERDSLRKTLLK